MKTVGIVALVALGLACSTAEKKPATDNTSASRVAPAAQASATTTVVVAPVPETKPAGLMLRAKGGMEIILRAEVEEHLEAWAKGDAPDAAVARKDGELVASVLERIDWSQFRKRERNAVAFDALVVKTRGYGMKLAAAAVAKDARNIQILAEQLITSCTDCHKQFR